MKFGAAVVVLAILLAGCGPSALEEKWSGAVVVKICHGTHIFRLKDGEYRTGGLFGSRVENIDTVCTQK